MKTRKRRGARIERGDDGRWFIDVSGVDVLRGPYLTRETARMALTLADPHKKRGR